MIINDMYIYDYKKSLLLLLFTLEVFYLLQFFKSFNTPQTLQDRLAKIFK